ncbi:small multi-drug export protein [Candidatus Saccharibacteria bacterium]|nr:small multi-drug export protein [Candidatus Saccharibacteria bacterium]
MNILHLLIVFFVSMVPLIELRGAVPIGVGLGLPEWLTLIIAIIGNMIPVPFIFWFSRKFLEWGATKKWKPLRNFCKWCLKKGEKAGKKLVEKKDSSNHAAETRNGIYIALLLFVGIPFPGTGAWTGTLAASFLDLNFKKTVIAVMCGVLLAGLIMLALSLGLFGVIIH